MFSNSVVAAAVLILAVAASGCAKRDPEELGALRDELRQMVGSAPLPTGAVLDHDRARFDPGCLNLVECPSGGAGRATYTVPVRLTDPQPAELCRYLVDQLPGLVTAWQGGRAEYAPDLSPLGSSVVPRWITVDAGACATGGVVSAVHRGVDVRWSDGLTYTVSKSLSTASTSLSPTGAQPLTGSQAAFLRGRLDRGFVLAARPAEDGVEAVLHRSQNNGTEYHNSVVTGKWAVPDGVTELRFTARCTPGSTLTIRAGGVERAAACTGQTGEVVVPAGPEVRVEHRGPQVRGGDEPFLVKFVP